MLSSLPGERWQVIKMPHKLSRSYAISNKGRLASFEENLKKDGRLVKGSLQEGYRIFRYRTKERNKVQHHFFFFHTLVAMHFCKQKSKNHSKIIFKDYKRTNLSASNLKWSTTEELNAHSMKSPRMVKARKNPEKGRKINLQDVVKIKALIKKGKTLKEIAARFDISDMQVHRIKTGENWGHVKG